MKMDLPKYITPSQNILFQELESESITLNLLDENYYGLDDVGTRIWQLLIEHDGKVDDMVIQMLAEYDVDEASLRQDIAELITQLSKAGIMTITD